MDVTLSDVEVRVLGCLVEKSISTPEYYPLTLNALVNACNQKSNRDPVVTYDDRTVVEGLDGLKEHGLVSVVMGGESRVPKYRHYFDEAYELTHPEMTVLCELMLRGPQTLGELRGRTERLDNHQTVDEMEITLESLLSHDPPLIVRMPRQPGRKEHRYMQTLAGVPEFSEEEAALSPEPARRGRIDDERVTRLEDEVVALRQEVAELQAQFETFRRQFE